MAQRVDAPLSIAYCSKKLRNTTMPPKIQMRQASNKELQFKYFKLSMPHEECTRKINCFAARLNQVINNQASFVRWCRGVKYVESMMRKCIMVKIGEAKKRKLSKKT